MRRRSAFTLIEIVISIFILMLLLALAIPSLSGVLSERRLHRSLDRFNNLVYAAQEKSQSQQRPYLLVWVKGAIELRPEVSKKDDDSAPVEVYEVEKGEALKLNLPAALSKDPPGEWIFWPTGNCEPAEVQFTGPSGSWTASYSPLTARAELTAFYAPR